MSRKKQSAPQFWLSRTGSLVAASAGALLWLYAARARPSRDIPYAGALLLGPMITLLSLTGAAEPKVLWSLRPEGKKLPFKYQLMGGAAALLGLVISAYMAYRADPLLSMER
jgi:hypothetical protein